MCTNESLINKINYSLPDKQQLLWHSNTLKKAAGKKYKLRIQKPLQTPTGKLSKDHSFTKCNSLIVSKVQVFKVGKF